MSDCPFSCPSSSRMGPFLGLLMDQPLSGVELAAWAVESHIRHPRPPPFARSAAARLPLHQFYYLDWLGLLYEAAFLIWASVHRLSRPEAYGQRPVRL